MSKPHYVRSYSAYRKCGEWHWWVSKLLLIEWTINQICLDTVFVFYKNALSHHWYSQLKPPAIVKYGNKKHWCVKFLTLFYSLTVNDTVSCVSQSRSLPICIDVACFCRRVLSVLLSFEAVLIRCENCHLQFGWNCQLYCVVCKF